MSHSSDADRELTTEDRLFSGKLRLIQPARGHRAGTDAVLLAAALPEGALHIADLGAATGIVGLRAAQVNPEAQVTLIEREGALVALARENIALNGLSSQVTAMEVDGNSLRNHPSFRERFDCILTNPPFLEANRTRVSRNPRRASAHVIEGTLDDWVRSATSMLAPRGLLVMIHRADALGDILKALAARFGGITLRFIHPEAGKPAIRVLVAGIKGSRAPLAVLPAIALSAAGADTELSRIVHQGEARIDMRAGRKARPPQLKS